MLVQSRVEDEADADADAVGYGPDRDCDGSPRALVGDGRRRSGWSYGGRRRLAAGFSRGGRRGLANGARRSPSPILEELAVELES